MTRTTLAVLALAVLGLAALGVVRELRPAGDEVGKAPAPTVTAQGGALRVRRAETPRPLPALRFVDGTGAARSLDEFRGRALLLNIWATWCVPCRKEMPALDRLQQALGGPGFEVVALSIDRGGIPPVKPFYAELGLRALRVYVDPSADALTKLGAVGIPLTMFVDREGRELWRVVGPVEWDAPEVVDRLRNDLAAAPSS
jgi:thiol-disulfide isomerase/thioredoxin